MGLATGFTGGGGDNVQQLIAGTGITLSPSSGLGIVTINSADGANVMLVDGGLCSTYRCGVDNSANGSYAFNGGGQCNASNGNHSFVGGGLCNCATACGAVLGGFGNNASAAFSGAFGCNINACNACTFYSNNLCACGNSSSITANVTCLTSGQAVCSGTNGILTNFTIPTTLSYGLYAQTADSVPVTATTAESSLIGTGVGTLSVPANGFSIGDSFIASLNGIISCIGTATIILKVQTLGGVVLADSGIIALDASTNRKWQLDIDFTIRNIGTAGVASISSGGVFQYIKNAGTNFEAAEIGTINNTTFDTTTNNTLIITAQWNTTNAGNSIFSRNFTLEKVY